MDPAHSTTSERTARVAVVLTGGGPVGPSVAELLPAAHLVIAADGGATHAAPLGLSIDLVVGDMDSIPPEVLEVLLAEGAALDRYPTDKDATDLELALDRAVAAGVERIVVVGGHGGRFDHLLGVALVLGSSAYSPIDVEAHLGPARLHVVRGGGRLHLEGEPGETITLLPLHGPARDVRTVGLRWSLDGEDLAPGSTRGLSNVLLGSEATVAVGLGTVLVVRPGAEPPAPGAHAGGAAADDPPAPPAPPRLPS